MRVTASWGHRFRLHDEQGTAGTMQARTRGKKIRPVCGDIVQASSLVGEKDWLIDSITARNNELARPDMRGRREVLAANVETVVVVVCAAPKADWFIVDRYIAAAEQMQCRALVVWNKSDEAGKPDEAATFTRIGYKVLATAKDDTTSISALSAALEDQRSIFVGQSGVGKSTLINALATESVLRTGAISDGSKEGRHTTVTAELLHLKNGIEVIDSPGVRDYAPSIASLADVQHGFIEIREIADDCKFSNCMHRAEPQCAVKAAVDGGEIDERRYQSFMRLVQLTRQLNEDRY